MDTLRAAIVLGFVTGLLGIVARRRPVAAWLMLTPLAFATYVAPPWAAGAGGAVAGAMIGAAVLWGRGLPGLTLRSSAGHAVSWGLAFGIAAWLGPNGAVAWCALGFWLGREWWGRGYATEANREVLRYGFAERRLPGFTSSHFVDNHASAGVLRKLGFGRRIQIATWAVACGLWTPDAEGSD